MDDDLSFADEHPSDAGAVEPWHILVVDDDEDVHTVTRVVMRDYQYDNRPIDLVDAHSAAEARLALAAGTRFAVILLDVVMEHESSGLDLVHYIRNTLQDHTVRIILRTGQPGQAPEVDVVHRYDIDDYREKTELTAERMRTVITTSLRAYHHTTALERQRDGLELVIRSATRLHSEQSARGFAGRAVTTAVDLLDRCFGTDPRPHAGLAMAISEEGTFTVLHDELEDGAVLEPEVRLPVEMVEHLREGRPLPASFFCADHFGGMFLVEGNTRFVLVVHGPMGADLMAQQLVRACFTYIAGACQGLHFVEDLRTEILGGRDTARLVRDTHARKPVVSAEDIEQSEHPETDA